MRDDCELIMSHSLHNCQLFACHLAFGVGVATFCRAVPRVGYLSPRELDTAKNPRFLAVSGLYDMELFQKRGQMK